MEKLSCICYNVRAYIDMLSPNFSKESHRWTGLHIGMRPEREV